MDDSQLILELLYEVAVLLRFTFLSDACGDMLLYSIC